MHGRTEHLRVLCGSKAQCRNRQSLPTGAFLDRCWHPASTRRKRLCPHRVVSLCGLTLKAQQGKPPQQGASNPKAQRGKPPPHGAHGMWWSTPLGDLRSNRKETPQRVASHGLAVAPNSYRLAIVRLRGAFIHRGSPHGRLFGRELTGRGGLGHPIPNCPCSWREYSR